MIAIMLNLITCATEMSSPFIVKRLIEFIQSNEDEDLGFGYGLVCILIAT